MLIIERFEGNTAIIEDGGKYFEVSREDLPENACEGDVLKKVGSIYEIDKEKTESRRNYNRRRSRRSNGRCLLRRMGKENNYF